MLVNGSATFLTLKLIEIHVQFQKNLFAFLDTFWYVIGVGSV